MFSLKLALTLWHLSVVLQLNLNDWKLHAGKRNHSVSLIVGPLGVAVANWHAAAVEAALKQKTTQAQRRLSRAVDLAKRGMRGEV